MEHLYIFVFFFVMGLAIINWYDNIIILQLLRSLVCYPQRQDHKLSVQLRKKKKKKKKSRQHPHE